MVVVLTFLLMEQVSTLPINLTIWDKMAMRQILTHIKLIFQVMLVKIRLSILQLVEISGIVILADMTKKV